MTVTTYAGLRVIADQQVETPLSTPAKPMYYTRIKKLLLSDGSEPYACGEEDCPFLSDSMGVVRSHLGRDHKTDRAAYGSRKALTRQVANQAVGGMAVADLLDAAAKAEQYRAERDEWRRRAQAAERDLAAVRRVFGGSPKAGER